MYIAFLSLLEGVFEYFESVFFFFSFFSLFFHYTLYRLAGDPPIPHPALAQIRAMQYMQYIILPLDVLN